jgi:hypothetical protein
MEVSGQLQDPAALRSDRAFGTHSIEGLLDLRDGLDPVERRQIYLPYHEWNPGRPNL